MDGYNRLRAATTALSTDELRDCVECLVLGLYGSEDTDGHVVLSTDRDWSDEIMPLDLPLPELPHLRHAATLLGYDALARATKGDSRGALDNVAAIFGIARHVCARRVERRATRERRLRLVETEGTSAPPDQIVEARRRAASVREALERLSPTERETLLLRYEADLSFREIGLACGIDEATARKRASRALARLRSVLPEGRT